MLFKTFTSYPNELLTVYIHELFITSSWIYTDKIVVLETDL